MATVVTFLVSDTWASDFSISGNHVDNETFKILRACTASKSPSQRVMPFGEVVAMLLEINMTQLFEPKVMHTGEEETLGDRRPEYFCCWVSKAA